MSVDNSIICPFGAYRYISISESNVCVKFTSTCVKIALPAIPDTVLLKIVPPVVWGATVHPPVPVEGIVLFPAVLTVLPLNVCVKPFVVENKKANVIRIET